jgi:hypothetical protein
VRVLIQNACHQYNVWLREIPQSCPIQLVPTDFRESSQAVVAIVAIVATVVIVVIVVIVVTVATVAISKHIFSFHCRPSLGGWERWSLLEMDQGS